MNFFFKIVAIHTIDLGKNMKDAESFRLTEIA